MGVWVDLRTAIAFVTHETMNIENLTLKTHVSIHMGTLNHLGSFNKPVILILRQKRVVRHRVPLYTV